MKISTLMVVAAVALSFAVSGCKYDKSRSLKKGEWVSLTAEIQWEDAPVYDGEGVVLYAKSVEKAEAPEDNLIYFR